MAALLQFSIAACCYRLYRSLGVLYIVLYCIILYYIALYCIILYYIVSLVSCEIIIWVPDLKSNSAKVQHDHVFSHHHQPIRVGPVHAACQLNMQQAAPEVGAVQAVAAAELDVCVLALVGQEPAAPVRSAVTKLLHLFFCSHDFKRLALQVQHEHLGPLFACLRLRTGSPSLHTFLLFAKALLNLAADVTHLQPCSCTRVATARAHRVTFRIQRFELALLVNQQLCLVAVFLFFGQHVLNIPC